MTLDRVLEDNYDKKMKIKDGFLAINSYYVVIDCDMELSPLLSFSRYMTL